MQMFLALVSYLPFVSTFKVSGLVSRRPWLLGRVHGTFSAAFTRAGSPERISFHLSRPRDPARRARIERGRSFVETFPSTDAGTRPPSTRAHPTRLARCRPAAHCGQSLQERGSSGGDHAGISNGARRVTPICRRDDAALLWRAFRL